MNIKAQKERVENQQLIYMTILFVIMNEYERNLIEFCYSLQHEVFLLICTLLSLGKAQMV